MGENDKRTEKETEVKEFVSKETHTNLKKKAAKARQSYAKKSIQSTLQELVSNKPLMALLAYVVVAIAAILVSVLACKIPVVAVCFIVIIETMIAACLHNLPIWLHALVAVAEIIFGAIFGKVVFMIIQAVLYAAAIVALKVIRQGK